MQYKASKANQCNAMQSKARQCKAMQCNAEHSNAKQMQCKTMSINAKQCFYEKYPANPNGSNYNTAILSNEDGRHIAMMPHLERSTFQWNWPFYPKNRKDEVSPWIMAFENAKTWLEKNS